MRKVYVYEDFDPTKLVLDEKFNNSNYRVNVLAVFKKDGKEFRMTRFLLDQLVFVNIVLVMATRCQVFPKLRMQLLNEVAEMINNGEDEGNEFNGLIIKCICCWKQAFEIYATLPPQNIGFKLTIDMDNLNQSRMWGGTEVQLEEAFQSILNKKK